MKTVKKDFEIRLNDSWRLTCDDLQYMVQKRTTSHGKEVWISQSYVATTKDILYRTFNDYSITLTNDALKKIDELPPRFSEFIKNINNA